MPSLTTSLTPAERVMAALRGEETDHIPFTAYENKFSWGRAERELRNDGFCVVMRQPSAFRIVSPNCPVRRIARDAEGRTTEATEIETPAGLLRAERVLRPGGQPWHVRSFFETEADYPALAAYLADLEYRENFEAVRRREAEGGGDFIMRGKLGYSPLQSIAYEYMGLEKFCLEWMERRDRILELYEILRPKFLEVARLMAGSPCPAVNLCGNVTANVISPAMFEEYYLPLYDAAASILQEGGKFCGVHFDGITRPYADAIARSRMDYVEALTPPPTCDVSVEDAVRLWPDKALWINFPSSVHLEPEEKIRSVTRRILEQARPCKRFIMGITEDVPADRWPGNYRIILDELRAAGVRGA